MAGQQPGQRSISPSNMGDKKIFRAAPGDRCSSRIDKSLTPASSHLLATRVQLPAQAGGRVLDVTSDAWKHLFSNIKHGYRWYVGGQSSFGSNIRFGLCCTFIGLSGKHWQGIHFTLIFYNLDNWSCL